ncbi:MAG: hypothetical protein WAV20_17485 [Blastocatellia bacterium]
MGETILAGRGKQITATPQSEWEEQLSNVPKSMKTRLAFMTTQHHQVRYFVVRELAHIGKPVAPALIAQRLSLPLDRVKTILDELEQRLFFVVRNKRGHVNWAYPITTDKTPHRLSFSTGERIYAA